MAATALADHRPATTDLDVLIIGAGISGIGAAYHLQDRHPGRSYAILEARDDLGGTWDLFRYPGIRSDSDLHTFAYEFKPWTEDKAIADGPSILRYIRETAQEHGILERIRFGRRATAARWSSEDARWEVDVEDVATGERETLTASWIFSACGYYRYDRGFTPDLPGLDDFEGQVIHPQQWPQDLDFAGKRVVVIGSGATAVTLVPAMAEQGAAHVTMLQRSPTYIMPVPERDPIANGLRKVMSDRRAYALTRRKNVWMQRNTWRFSKRYPGAMRKVIRAVNKKMLDGAADVDVHFKPRYDPWDQRLCAVPDGDLFKALRRGSASVVTDTIETFTPTGIRLSSGEELAADIVVTATGLELLAFGGLELEVDDEPVDLSETVAYKAMMLSGVPNFVYAVGYINSSWTLKVDLVCEHWCRMLARADAIAADTVTPHLEDVDMERRPLLDFKAGYVLRALDRFPKQGTSGAWTIALSYAEDLERLRNGPVEDPALRFSSSARDAAGERPLAVAA